MEKENRILKITIDDLKKEVEFYKEEIVDLLFDFISIFDLLSRLRQKTLQALVLVAFFVA